MGLIKNLEAYREERLNQFDEAYEKLRQELVEDLAKQYRKAGIPVIFRYKTSGRATLEMKVVGGDEFTEALVEGDEKQISAALSSLLVAFVAIRNRSGESDTP